MMVAGILCLLACVALIVIRATLLNDRPRFSADLCVFLATVYFIYGFGIIWLEVFR